MGKKRASTFKRTFGISLFLAGCAVFSFDMVILGLIATWVINK